MAWKHWVIFVLGVFVLLLPFLGFPPKVDTGAFFLFGGTIALLSFMNIRALYARDGGMGAHDNEFKRFGKEVREMTVTRATHEESLAE